MARKRHVNEFLRRETGRVAGSGMVHDSYDDESYPRGDPWKKDLTPIPKKKEKREPDPVRTYKLSSAELAKYKTEE